MKDIKTKEKNGKPKTRSPVSRMPKELVRTTALELKEKSHQAVHSKENDRQGQAPAEYGGEKLESAEEWSALRVKDAASAAGRKAVKKSYEKIRQRKSTEETARNMEQPAGNTSGQTEVPEESPSFGNPSSRTGENVKDAAKEKAKETAKAAAEQGRIRVKPQNDRLPSTTHKYEGAKSPRTVKTAGISKYAAKGKRGSVQTQQVGRRIHTAKKSAERSVQTARASAKRAGKTVKGVTAGVKAAAAASKSLFMTLGAAGGAIAVLLILIVGIIGGAAFSGNTSSAEPLSNEVLAYSSVIQKYASQYNIPEYVSVIQAIMMQESGGRGTDPMQSSECPYNTRYPNSPNAIQDADYSIEVGIQYYASCVKEAGCDSPYDMDKLKLSLQGYNYGNGYITWAIRKFGGYSEANALQFSQEQAASHGWARYGDPEYVPHVLRYYSGGNLFAGLFANDQIVTVAKGQLGNEGGQKFWSWYGFQGRVEWCACFVSWCADQSGLISSGSVLKFSYCPTGVEWFKSQGKWRDRGYMPTPGTIIFFDWPKNGVQDGNSDHVGIVEKCENGIVYTIEGNSGDCCKQNSYPLGYASILGYGLLS